MEERGERTGERGGGKREEREGGEREICRGKRDREKREGEGGERETERLTLTYLIEQANSAFQWGNKRLTEPKIYIQ